MLKTVRYLDYRTILGKPRPTRLEISDQIRASERTELIYSDLRREDTPDIWFQPSYLPRL